MPKHTNSTEVSPVDAAMRRRWMAALAKAAPGELEALWARVVGEPPAYLRLRGPETGLLMTQGRIGGSGEAFNLGEMSVTRCAVQLADGTVGHAYVSGRRPRQAELAAVADALLQDEAGRAALLDKLISPLVEAAAARRRTSAMKAAATKVEFFTVAREAGR